MGDKNHELQAVKQNAVRNARLSSIKKRDLMMNICCHKIY